MKGAAQAAQMQASENLVLYTTSKTDQLNALFLRKIRAASCPECCDSDSGVCTAVYSDSRPGMTPEHR
eukprot:93323-Amphidinium_carterae.2